MLSLRLLLPAPSPIQSVHEWASTEANILRVRQHRMSDFGYVQASATGDPSGGLVAGDDLRQVRQLDPEGWQQRAVAEYRGRSGHQLNSACESSVEHSRIKLLALSAEKMRDDLHTLRRRRYPSFPKKRGLRPDSDVVWALALPM